MKHVDQLDYDLDYYLAGRQALEDMILDVMDDEGVAELYCPICDDVVEYRDEFEVEDNVETIHGVKTTAECRECLGSLYIR